MGSRTLPYECPHGRTLDWGNFGPDPDDGLVGAERCDECNPQEMGYCDNDCCQETAPLGSEHCRGYPVLPFDESVNGAL